MRKMFKLSNLFLFMAIVALITTGCVSSGKKEKNEPATLQIEKHELDVSFDLQKHTINATDEVTLKMGAEPGNKAQLYISQGLKVESVMMGKNNLPFTANNNFNSSQYERNEHTLKGTQQISVVLPKEIKARGNFTLTVRYGGVIYDPVIKKDALRFVTADNTKGLVSEDGIFLHGPSLWYPTVPFAFSKFNITAKVPEAWHVVTQGEMSSRKINNGEAVVTWRANHPTDSLALFAAERVMNSKKLYGVNIYTFFTKDNATLSDKYIEACGEYIKFFNEVLGPYPYKTFSVAENFFASGFGMPTYTLLGPGSIARGAWNEYDLGHEIAHNYWGNGCHMDYNSSNWCEGLTVYTSNYYYLEKVKGPQEAKIFRLKKSLTYTAYVKPGMEYPLEKFHYKTKELDNQVGYMQSAMTFHAVRLRIGDKAFFKGLRNIVEEKMYDRVGWNDFHEAFETTSGQDLDWFFTQALKKEGIPSVKLENVKTQLIDGVHHISFTLSQEGGPYRFILPVVLRTKDGPIVKNIEMTSPKETFNITTDKMPVKMELDPDYHVIRRLNPDEMPACMLATLHLNPGKVLAVYPAKGNPKENEVYKGLAMRLQQQVKATVKTDMEVTEKDLKENSLFLFGRPSANSAFAKLLPKLKDKFGYKGNDLYIGDIATKPAVFKGDAGALIVSDRNPFNDKYFFTAFAPQSMGPAMGFSRILFFFDTYGYVYFEGRAKKAVGRFDAPRTSTTHNFSASMTK